MDSCYSHGSHCCVSGLGLLKPGEQVDGGVLTALIDLIWVLTHFSTSSRILTAKAW